MPLQLSDLEKKLERLKPNDHLCLIYESPEEWRAAIIPFLTIGLKRGEKCIYIVGTHTASHIRNYLNKAGIDVADVEASGQFVILHKTDAYTQEGFFDPDRMISLLIAESEKAIAEGYPGLRVTEEVSVRPRGYLGLERLLEYEAKLNRDFFPRYPCVAICQYDRWKSDPGIIKNAIMAHPLIVRNNQIHQNFYYVSPEEFLMQKREEKEVQDWLSSIEQEGEAQKRVRFLSDVLERSSQPFTVSYSDGHIMFCNPAFSALTGYTEEELHIMTWAIHLTPPEWRESEAKVLEELRRTGMPQRYEKECIRKDGSQIPIEVFIHQISDARGNVQYYYTFITDITERKKVEEMLWLSEKRFKSLFQDSPISLWEEDFSHVKTYIDTLRDSGVKDFREYFESHPEFVAKCAAMVKIIDVNNISLELFEARDKEELLIGLDMLFIEESYDAFREELNAIAECKHSCETEIVAQTLAGNKKFLAMKWSVAPGHEETFSRLLVSIVDITERTKAEDALKLFSESVDSSIDGISMGSPEGKITYVNEAFVRMFGYSREELIGKEIAFIYPEDQIPKLKEALKATLEGGWTGELVGKRKNGELFPMAISSSMVVDDGGKIIAQMANHKDITDRKRAEEVLKESEKKFRELANLLPQTVYEMDLEGNLTFANKHGFETFGYTQEDIDKSLNALLLFIPEDRDRMKENIRKIASGEELGGNEYTSLRKDGSTFPVLIYSTAIIRESKPVGLRGVVIDMTEHKRAEERLHKLSHAVEQSPSIVMITDTKGNIEYVNPKFTQITGYTSNEIIGTKAMNLGRQSPEEQKQMWDSITSGREWRGEFLNKKKNGETYWEFASISPIRNNEDVITHFLKVAEDVTERKLTEERLTKLNRCFLLLGPDARKNIEMIVRTAGDILGGACMLYNRLDRERRMLCTWGIWQEPEGYNPEDHPEGHICYDLIKEGKVGPVVIENLEGTKYEKTDPNVKKYKLKSYLGYPVRLKGEVVGSFCLYDVKKRKFTEQEVNIIGMLAKAVAIEEDRKRAEDTLRESEKEYRDLVEKERDVIYTLDIQGNITSVNSAAKTWGYQPQELIGKNFRDLISKEWLKETVEDFHSLLKTGEIVAETVIIDKKGESHFGEYSSSVIKENNKVVGARGIIRDITQRKRVEQVLRNSEEFLRSIIESTSDAIVSVDHSGNIVFWNNAAKTLFGYSSDEIVGKPLTSIIPERFRKVHEKGLKRMTSDRKSNLIGKVVEIIGLRKDGSEFPAEMILSCWKMKEGISFTSIIRVVTEHKRVKDTLQA